MNAFAKGVLFYAVQIAVALPVGTVVGSALAIGFHKLAFGEVDRDQAIGIVNGAIWSTMTIIVLMTAIGVLPVRSKAGLEKPKDCDP